MRIPTYLAALSLTISTTFAADEKILFDFQKDADTSGWAIEDDSVMGGLSKGRFRLTPEGHGEFSGDVSLENDGGFSSLQWNFDPIDARGFSRFVIRVRGDGKRYLLLSEAAPGDRHYYQAEFQTNGDWQTLEIPFADMVPHFRGDRLDQPNLPGKTIAQVRFMIANKKAESFRLEIDRVGLR